MSLYASLADVRLTRPQVVTIGVFDGVHRGHQYLIAQAVEAAAVRGAEVTVLAFWPPPIVVLRPETPPRCLTLAPEKLDALRQLPGVAHIVIIPFTPELAAQSAAAFVADLQAHMPLVALVEGDDFTLGHNREGTISWLTAYGEQAGIDVLPVSRRLANDQPISSTRIRNLLEAGDVVQARALLGRPYQLSGEVVHGDARGRTLGYPTANLETDPLKLVPANGIYAVRAWRATTPHDVWQGAANIGIRPTFDGRDRRVEVHLLDVSPDVYGQMLQVEFFARLREEQRFASATELVKQMAADVTAARQVLSTETGA